MVVDGSRSNESGRCLPVTTRYIAHSRHPDCGYPNNFVIRHRQCKRISFYFNTTRSAFAQFMENSAKRNKFSQDTVTYGGGLAFSHRPPFVIDTFKYLLLVPFIWLCERGHIIGRKKQSFRYANRRRTNRSNSNSSIQ